MDMEIINKLREIKQLREHYKKTYFCQRYSGWRDEFDIQFDPYSTWFANRQKDVYCRVTYRNEKDPFPIDFAKFDVQSPTGPCVEINNFNYPREKLRYAISFIQAILANLQSEGVTRVYCVVDELSRFAYQLNTDTFGFSDLQQARIFDGIKYDNSETLVKWRLLARDLIE